ncbi:MAG TPA: hypothetical protein VGM78_13070 [Ilumatobacteraceae bacterium]
MQHRHRIGFFAAAALIGSVVSVAVGSGFGPVPAVHAAGLGAGGEYHPLTPKRIFDTRTVGVNGATGSISSSSTGGSVAIHVLGQGGVPSGASDVLAVAMSITVVSPTVGGYLQAYPTGSNAGTSSVLNFDAGQTVPNLTVLTIGTSGEVTVNLVTPTKGKADVLIDVFGWFSTSTYATSGARLIPVGPARLYDSRDTAFAGAGQPMGQASTLTIPIRGADALYPTLTDVVPNSTDVVGVVLNITGINNLAGSTNTFMSALPETPTSAPTTSNLNLAPGQVKANLVIVPVTNADGAIRIYNNAGRTDVAVDVVGYMKANQDPSTRLGRVIPLSSPFRVFDTRDPAFGGSQLGPGQAESWSFTQFMSSVMLNGQPVGSQVALLGNLTGTGLTRVFPTKPAATYLTLYPSDAPSRPQSSNINVTEGVNVPNMIVVKVGADGQIKAYNNDGYLHYLLDVSAVVLSDS